MAEAQVIQRTNEEWIAREKELLEKISHMEKEKIEMNKEYEEKYEVLTSNLAKSKDEINDLLKKISIFDKLLLELKNKQAAVVKSPNDIKKDDLLTKAKELLFEQTKISKNQEMQIEALNTQLASVNDVLTVTREMLEIRNTEIEHMKARMETVEIRLKTERDLMEKRFGISEKMYQHLKQEHDIQTDLFKELKAGYAKKLELITEELHKEKAKIAKNKAEAQAENTKQQNGGTAPAETK